MAEPAEGLEHKAEHVGEGLMHALTHKLGPLPVWAYMAGVGAGIALVLYARKKNGSDGAAVTPAAPVAGDPGTGTGGTGSGGTTSPIDPTALDTLQQQESADVQSLAGSIQGLADRFQSLQGAINWTSSGLGFVPGTGLDTGSGAMVLAPYVAGGPVLVPRAVVANSGRSETALAASGYRPAGGFSATPYVAGAHPASASSPAGGGTYAGLTDAQTATLFQNTYGNGWQQVWQGQHDAEVAANGG